VRKKRAFTLIELLVVISVIAILAAMLLPALALARDKAKSALCQSQQKNISLAIEFYVNDDWNNRYMISRDRGTFWGTGRYCPMGPCSLLRYVSYNHDIYPQTYDRLKIFHCPSTDNWDFWYYRIEPLNNLPVYGPKENYYVDWWYSIGWRDGEIIDGHFGNDVHWEMPYGFNQWRTWHLDMFPCNKNCASSCYCPYRKHIRSPDCKYLVADCSKYIFAHTGTADGWPATTWGDMFVPRHQFGCNIIYIDGHVKWSSYRDIELRDNGTMAPSGWVTYLDCY
jgi:prepilin-type N-terminal cleavage/methylation domain-containing protein/prepilin-type processing-associated H-X9-DG protein